MASINCLSSHVLKIPFSPQTTIDISPTTHQACLSCFVLSFVIKNPPSPMALVLYDKAQRQVSQNLGEAMLPSYPDDVILMRPMTTPLALVPCCHSLGDEAFLSCWRHTDNFPQRQIRCPLCRTPVTSFIARFGPGAFRLRTYRDLKAKLNKATSSSLISKLQDDLRKVTSTPETDEFDDALLAVWHAYEMASPWEDLSQQIQMNPSIIFMGDVSDEQLLSQFSFGGDFRWTGSPLPTQPTMGSLMESYMPQIEAFVLRGSSQQPPQSSRTFDVDDMIDIHIATAGLAQQQSRPHPQQRLDRETGAHSDPQPYPPLRNHREFTYPSPLSVFRYQIPSVDTFADRYTEAIFSFLTRRQHRIRNLQRQPHAQLSPASEIEYETLSVYTRPNQEHDRSLPRRHALQWVQIPTSRAEHPLLGLEPTTNQTCLSTCLERLFHHVHDLVPVNNRTPTRHFDDTVVPVRGLWSFLDAAMHVAASNASPRLVAWGGLMPPSETFSRRTEEEFLSSVNSEVHAFWRQAVPVNFLHQHTIQHWILDNACATTTHLSQPTLPRAGFRRASQLWTPFEQVLWEKQPLCYRKYLQAASLALCQPMNTESLASWPFGDSNSGLCYAWPITTYRALVWILAEAAAAFRQHSTDWDLFPEFFKNTTSTGWSHAFLEAFPNISPEAIKHCLHAVFTDAGTIICLDLVTLCMAEYLHADTMHHSLRLNLPVSDFIDQTPESNDGVPQRRRRKKKNCPQRKTQHMQHKARQTCLKQQTKRTRRVQRFHQRVKHGRQGTRRHR